MSRWPNMWTCLVLAATGCGPSELPARGQVVLTLLTDAPLPRATEGDGSTPPALFDRVRIDVYPAGASQPCAQCTQVEDLDHARVAAGELSFGVITDGGSATVRARLYRRAGQLDDSPTVAGSVDAWLHVPQMGDGDVAQRWFVLPTDHVAAPIGSLDQPVELSAGSRPRDVVGSWIGAERVDCTAPTAPGETCVPGGAYWMGNAAAEGFLASETTPERLVILSPFIMHTAEVSVAMVRQAGWPIPPEAAFSGSPDGDAFNDWCSFAADGSRDGLPMNCISWESARAFCQQIHPASDLPTEAQIEYVAGALQSRLYPWGSSTPTCGDAVFGRGAQFDEITSISAFNDHCPPEGIGGPLAVDRIDHGRDVVALPGGSTIVDIAGNLAEMTRDRFEHYGTTCWGTGVALDPICAGDDPVYPRTAKSGAWVGEPEQIRSAQRQIVAEPWKLFAEMGFRCVRPGT